MKKTELKKILKPLIKECVREAILEEGILSGIIAEVARGVSPPVASSPPPPADDPIQTRMQRNAFAEGQSEKLKEHKKKLMDAIGGGAYNGVNLFEGTTPAPSQLTPEQQAYPMAGQSASDAGVDISNLFGKVGNHWNAHMNEMKE